MAAMSDYLEGQLADHLARTATFAKPATFAIALVTASTVDADTGATITEVANTNGYARQAVILDAKWTDPGVGGLMDNVDAIAFPAASGGNWGTVVGIAICDSATWGGGNMLLHGDLTASRVVNDGDTFQFAIGDLDITFA